MNTQKSKRETFRLGLIEYFGSIEETARFAKTIQQIGIFLGKDKHMNMIIEEKKMTEKLFRMYDMGFLSKVIKYISTLKKELKQNQKEGTKNDLQNFLLMIAKPERIKTFAQEMKQIGFELNDKTIGTFMNNKDIIVTLITLSEVGILKTLIEIKEKINEQNKQFAKR